MAITQRRKKKMRDMQRELWLTWPHAAGLVQELMNEVNRLTEANRELVKELDE